MTSERRRAFLGVWMPLILGGIVIAVALNFFLTNSETPDGWPKDFSWDAWRSVCTGALVFVGVVLGLSTLGRYRKAKAARRESGGPPIPPPSPPP